LLIVEVACHPLVGAALLDVDNAIYTETACAGEIPPFNPIVPEP
jgi:hypothetical protein